MSETEDVFVWGAVLTAEEIQRIADGADPRTIRPEALAEVDDG